MILIIAEKRRLKSGRGLRFLSGGEREVRVKYFEVAFFCLREIAFQRRTFSAGILRLVDMRMDGSVLMMKLYEVSWIYVSFLRGVIYQVSSSQLSFPCSAETFPTQIVIFSFYSNLGLLTIAPGVPPIYILSKIHGTS